MLVVRQGHRRKARDDSRRPATALQTEAKMGFVLFQTATNGERETGELNQGRILAIMKTHVKPSRNDSVEPPATLSQPEAKDAPEVAKRDARSGFSHTPTPWTFKEMDNDKVIPSIRIFGQRSTVINGTKLSDILCIGRLDSRRDAEFACKAVNCHDELLAACKAALFALGECSVGREKLSDLFSVKVKQLESAIKKASKL